MNNINQAINEIRSFGKYGYNTADGKRVSRQYIKEPAGLSKDLRKQVRSANAEMKAQSRSDSKARAAKLQALEDSGLAKIRINARKKQIQRKAERELDAQRKAESELNKANDDSRDLAKQSSINNLRQSGVNKLLKDITSYQAGAKDRAKNRAEERRAGRQAMRDAEIAASPNLVSQYKQQDEAGRRNIVDNKFKEFISGSSDDVRRQNKYLNKYAGIIKNRNESSKPVDIGPESSKLSGVAKGLDAINRAGESVGREVNIAKDQARALGNDAKTAVSDLGKKVSGFWGRAKNKVNDTISQVKDAQENRRLRAQLGFSVKYDRNTRSFSVIKKK